MGFLKDLFAKKECAVCGGEIGLLGNRKVEDGNLCKSCAAKLSPWFSERRHSTVAQISEQLRYREANLDRVARFRETRSYGDDTRLYIDDQTQTFMITSSRNWTRDNPDVVDYACVTDCRAEIREERSEVYRKDPEGHSQPFDPPRYDYSYSFYVTVYVNHPWFDDMRFALDTYVEEDRTDDLNRLTKTCEDIVEKMTGRRPDLSGEIHFHPPFCRRCGRDLPPHTRRCPFCEGAPGPAGREPARDPHAPAGPVGNGPQGNAPRRPQPEEGAEAGQAPRGPMPRR